MKYLQIIDGVVVSTFAGPQDPDASPDLLEVEDDDPRYLAAIAPSQPEPTSQRDSLLAVASQAIAPLLLSLQLGDATDEETASAKAWQAYVRKLKTLDLTTEPIAWPKQPA